MLIQVFIIIYEFKKETLPSFYFEDDQYFGFRNNLLNSFSGQSMSNDGLGDSTDLGPAETLKYKLEV